MGANFYKTETKYVKVKRETEIEIFKLILLFYTEQLKELK